jgi:hypothetical protein
MQVMAKKITRTRQSLASIGGVVSEMATIYREMKSGKRDHKEGRSLVWVLSELRAAVEAQALERIEARLAELGETADIAGPRRGAGVPALGTVH